MRYANSQYFAVIPQKQDYPPYFGFLKNLHIMLKCAIIVIICSNSYRMIRTNHHAFCNAEEKRNGVVTNMPLKSLKEIWAQGHYKTIQGIKYQECMLIFDDGTTAYVWIKEETLNKKCVKDTVTGIEHMRELLDNCWGIEKKPTNYPHIDRNDMDILCFRYMGGYYRQTAAHLTPM